MQRLLKEHGTHLCSAFVKPEAKELWKGTRLLWEQKHKEKTPLTSGDTQCTLEELMMYLVVPYWEEKADLWNNRNESDWHANMWKEYFHSLKDNDGLYWKYATAVMKEHGTHLCSAFVKPEAKELWKGTRLLWEQKHKEKTPLT